MPDDEPFKVWYAKDSRAKAAFKWVVYDDRGHLWLRDGIVAFVGRRHTIKITNIESVILTQQRFNWVTHVVISTLFYFSIANRYTSLVAFFVIGYVWILSLLITHFTPWIKLTASSEDGSSYEFWFASSRFFGWGGILGETHELHERLISIAADPNNGTTAPIDVARFTTIQEMTVEEECPYCAEFIVPTEDDRCPECDRPI